MPAVVVLILCKTVSVGDGADANSDFTTWQVREWAYENSMMTCRREVVALEDAGAMGGGPTVPFTPHACMFAGIMAIPEWESKHKNSQYRVWRVACPTPIKNYGADGLKGTPDDETVDWVLPDCGHPDTVICEKDSAI